MNDVNFKVNERKVISFIPYINTVNRTTQYNLYILTKYVKTRQFLNCDEQFLKKNKKKGTFEQLVRKTAFSKIFENNIYAPKMHHTCTIHYCACIVHVWCMYGACMVHFENWGLSRVFFVWCKLFAVKLLLM